MNSLIKRAIQYLPAIAIPHQHFRLSSWPVSPEETALRVEIPPLSFDKESKVGVDVSLYDALTAEGFFRVDQIPTVAKMIANKIPLPRQWSLSALPQERIPGQGMAITLRFETPVNGAPFVREKTLEVSELKLQQMVSVVEWVMEAQAMKDRSRGEK